MTGLARFEVEMEPTGHGSVKINGEDVSNDVSGLTLEAQVGRPPILALHYIPGSSVLRGEGVVQVPGPVVENPNDMIVEFLESIDPEVLERRVLNESDLTTSGIETTLQILALMARGK